MKRADKRNVYSLNINFSQLTVSKIGHKIDDGEKRKSLSRHTFLKDTNQFYRILLEDGSSLELQISRLTQNIGIPYTKIKSKYCSYPRIEAKDTSECSFTIPSLEIKVIQLRDHYFEH